MNLEMLVGATVRNVTTTANSLQPMQKSRNPAITDENRSAILVDVIDLGGAFSDAKCDCAKTINTEANGTELEFVVPVAGLLCAYKQTNKSNPTNTQTNKQTNKRKTTNKQTNTQTNKCGCAWKQRSGGIPKSPCAEQTHKQKTNKLTN